MGRKYKALLGQNEKKQQFSLEKKEIVCIFASKLSITF